MIALLRYLSLKGMREGSLIAFVLGPILLPLAGLCGVTFRRGLHYPFFMDPQYSAVQNATLAAEIAWAMCVVFAAIPAFWALRSEIATRSIGSLALAARPLTISLTLILFAAAVAMSAWIGAVTVIAVMTSALPAHFGLATLKLAVSSIAVSAAGALVVMISTEPAMIIGCYLACVVVIPIVEKNTKAPMQLLIAGVLAIVCAGLSVLLLERRCAS